MNDQDWSRGQRDYLSVVELFVRTIIRFGDVIRHENERNHILIYGLRPHVMDCLLRKIVSSFLSFKVSRLNLISDRILVILILSTNTMQFSSKTSSSARPATCTIFYICIIYYFLLTKFLS